MKLYNSPLEGNKQWVRERLALQIQTMGFAICVIFATFLSTILNAQVYPPGFGQTRIASPILVPVAAALAPDGRFFVVEQTGNVRVVKNNVLLETPFVSLTVDSNGERGLVGVAVDPDFLVNKYIYVYYCKPGTPARNRVSRFTATNDTAAPGSETVILDLDPLGSAFIHNGGALHFGKDGKLYVAVGDNAVTANAQNLDTYHGKLLRINKDGSAPADNPFPTGSEQRKRVWAYGLRNPFTFAVDLETGKIFINDVGASSWEEINDATLPGRNFGWPATEGTFNAAAFPSFTNPVYAYAHGTGDGVGCAIVGGAFISPSNPYYPPEYRGKYVFQESCNSWFNILDLSGPVAVRSPFVTETTRNSVGLMTDIDGYMYFVSRHERGLFKIVYDGGIEPSITDHPADARVVVGQPASFAVSAVGTPPLTYQWQKNGQNIPGATSATFMISECIVDDSGEYRAIVTNTDGQATSNIATLSVIVNSLPTAEILTPTGEVPYIAGETINFSGQGSDPEDGQLPPESMTWRIYFHHDTHHHDEPPRSGISSGSFTIPQLGETSANVWYRIYLEVTDSEGFTSEDFVDIFPLKSTLTFNTNPAGLQILLEGQPFNTPGSVLSVEGLIRTIDAPSIQNLGNESYAFESWTHGGAKNQNITTPSADVTYTANFTQVESNFYRAININGPALTIDGNNWEASSTAPGYSVTNGIAFSNQNVPLVPATDAARATMIRSSVWSSNVTVSLGSMPAGSYTVFLYVWEDNVSNTFTVRMEGQIVQANYVSGSAGQWSKLGPFTVNVADGALTVNAMGAAPNLSGLEIWTAGAIPPSVTTPLVDQVATVGSPMNYTFAANSFSGSALTYASTLTNGSPLPSWLSFTPGTRTFSGTPAAGDVGALAVRVTATNSASSVSDDFTLTVNAAPVMPTLVLPLQDQNVNAGTPLIYVIPEGSFSGTGLAYAALLSNGSSLPSWLTFTPATRTFSGTPSASNVGTISVRVTATNGGGSANDIFDITVNSTGTSTFYRAININGPALTIDGNNWEASSTASGYSVTNGIAFSNQNVTLVPATDAARATMIRSSVWSSNVTVSLGSMPTGSYTVYLYVWEDNVSNTYTVRMEGQIVQANYVSGGAGQWAKLGPFTVNVADGALTVNATGPAPNLSGLEIWTPGGASAGRMAIAESSSSVLPEEESLELTAYPNPFSTRATIVYKATQAGPTSITLYDMRGLKVWSTPEKNVSIGHTESVDMETSGFDYGVYVLELINGRSVKRQKMVKIR
jgi:glucose/arabinose dehydrogenase